MRVNYSVTFESEKHPPLTHRGTVQATSMPMCFRRAARAAVQAYPRTYWTSMVCALERLDKAAPSVPAGGNEILLPKEPDPKDGQPFTPQECEQCGRDRVTGGRRCYCGAKWAEMAKSVQL